MTRQAADYTMVLPVQHFRIDESRVAVESAFAEHLRMMRSRIEAVAERLVVVSPGMSASTYEAGRRGYAVIDEKTEGIVFHTLFSLDDVRSKGAKIRLFL